jgi:hypothetical protein
MEKSRKDFCINTDGVSTVRIYCWYLTAAKWHLRHSRVDHETGDMRTSVCVEKLRDMLQRHMWLCIKYYQMSRLLLLLLSVTHLITFQRVFFKHITWCLESASSALCAGARCFYLGPKMVGVFPKAECKHKYLPPLCAAFGIHCEMDG